MWLVMDGLLAFSSLTKKINTKTLIIFFSVVTHCGCRPLSCWLPWKLQMVPECQGTPAVELM
jgi:hypothetical protein